MRISGLGIERKRAIVILGAGASRGAKGFHPVFTDGWVKSLKASS